MDQLQSVVAVAPAILGQFYISTLIKNAFLLYMHEVWLI